MALDRLQQARTYEAVVVGHALPEVDASAAAARGTGTDLARGRADAGAGIRGQQRGALQHINTLAGFDAVWELDIFGKFRREFEAARDELRRRAPRATACSPRSSPTWCAPTSICAASRFVPGSLHKASDVLRESLRIVNIRYERGITNELDVALATRELATLEAEIAPVEAEVNAAQNTLAVLRRRVSGEHGRRSCRSRI